MSKNGRRILFLLVATVANMLLTVVLIVGFYLLWSLLASAIGLNLGNDTMLVLMAIFVISMVASGIVYGRVLRYFRNRPELVERFGLSK